MQKEFKLILKYGLKEISSIVVNINENKQLFDEQKKLYTVSVFSNDKELNNHYLRYKNRAYGVFNTKVFFSCTCINSDGNEDFTCRVSKLKKIRNGFSFKMLKIDYLILNFDK